MSKKKSEKPNKGKLPKTIAGVKLPKQARRQAEKAIAELQKPIVREMIAGAIGVAATAIAKQASTTRAASAAPKPAPDKAAAPKSNVDQFAEIATGLAMAGLGQFFGKMSAALEAAKAPEANKKR